jgi:hypothetical protein
VILVARLSAAAFRRVSASFRPVTANHPDARLGGRPPKLDDDQVATAARWRADGVPVPEIARRLHVSETTVYCRVPAPLLPLPCRPRGRPFDRRKGSAMISITIEGGRCWVQTPYLPALLPGFRQLGGRWDALSHRWSFDSRDEDRVRQLLLDQLGTDGGPDVLVDCRLDLDQLPRTAYPRYEPLRLGALTVVERPGRDRPVSLGEGVVVIQGGFPPRGGSAKNPSWESEAGTILEVRDVPAALVRRLAEHMPGLTVVGSAH